MSAVTSSTVTQMQDSASTQQLKNFVARIERLTEEKKALSEDITSVYSEAKASGYDTKVMRELIKIRAKDPQEVEEMDNLLDLYKQAMGMI